MANNLFLTQSINFLSFSRQKLPELHQEAAPKNLLESTPAASTPPLELAPPIAVPAPVMKRAVSESQQVSTRDAPSAANSGIAKSGLEVSPKSVPMSQNSETVSPSSMKMSSESPSLKPQYTNFSIEYILAL